MLENKYDVIIIGAGPAGLSLSYFLQKYKCSHLILEKSRPFSAWYDRFDHFRMNTANWMNELPGAAALFEDKNHLQLAPEQLATGTQILEYFLQYTKAVNPPIQTLCDVTKIRCLGDYDWEITSTCGQFCCRSVVVCTGTATKQKWPDVASRLPADIPSLYANAYRNPQQIKTNRILVVGSGSSGIQICEDLACARQFSEVILSVSGNRRFPWKILGTPIHTIVKRLGLFELGSDSRLARWIIQLSSQRGDPATPPSPKNLARRYGVKCVRKIESCEENFLMTSDGQRINLQDLTIIWCTGYGPDYSLLPDSVLAVIKRTSGWPTASHGKVPGFPGLYFLGLRFQSILSSHILYGIARDAAKTAKRIQAEIL